MFLFSRVPIVLTIVIIWTGESVGEDGVFLQGHGNHSSAPPYDGSEAEHVQRGKQRRARVRELLSFFC